MKKVTLWIAVIVVVVVVSAYAFDRYRQHLMDDAAEEFLRFVNEMIVEHDVFCTFDSGTGECFCSPEKTNVEKPLNVKECLTLASENLGID